MTDDEMSPYLDNFFTREELLTLAGLLEKLTEGLRKFYGLPYRPPADTPGVKRPGISHSHEKVVNPKLRIAVLEDLLMECWDLTDADDPDFTDEIEWTRPKLDLLVAALARAESAGEASFIFEGRDLVTAWAKRLAEHLDERLAP